MKKIGVKISVFMMLSCLLVLAACGNKEEKSSTDGNEKGKTLIAGTNAAFAPFEYMDKGKVTGFDVDLVEAVAKEAGYKVEVKHEGWDAMLANLQSKQSDLAIAGITMNDERKKTYDFTKPYFEATNMIVVKKESDIKNALDLKDKKIGVQNGTTGQEAAEKILGNNNGNIAKYKNITIAFMALKNNEVDAVVIDNVVGNEYVKNNPKENLKVVMDKENFDSEFYGMAFPKGSKLTKEFDQAFQKMIDNGTYAEIYKKWFKEEPDMESLKKAEK
ncbi:polar amino acid transport system substrate-binding protein [Oikeobacillus pervagus]|uniref:Polar amino acid transport system substrate-binding protein n=1 Tax=Oikeobacillus pervagus TaxID=1325931 RepID=A0AAJ1T3Z6_9BACI|nr:basic amino acid ABC transporter substrate-binding protein [Oikeobacillus pervagus]MDQ0216322.1 polar amino acid transport system substrate-binding protein [Oikeobacillus pervagus]